MPKFFLTVKKSSLHENTKIEHPSINPRSLIGGRHPKETLIDLSNLSCSWPPVYLDNESSSIQTYLRWSEFVPDSPTSVLGWLTCSAKGAKVNVDKWTFSLTWSLFVLILNPYIWRYLKWTAKDLSQSWPDQIEIDALHSRVNAESHDLPLGVLTDCRIPPELWVIPISKKIILGRMIYILDSFYTVFSGPAVPAQFVHRWMRYCDCE